MARVSQTQRNRRRLDPRFQSLKPTSRFSIPVRGWIRAIREGLGMTTAQLGRRLGVSQPSVVAMEQSEAKGTIELATLRRVAAALDCTVVYALVPNRSLEEMVRDRARLLQRKRQQAVEHSMALEDQAVEPVDEEAAIDEILRETVPGRLWDEM